MRPIRKRLLIHSAILKGNVVKDAWGKVVSEDDIDLSYVRVEPTDKLVLSSKTNKEVKLNSLIFFDITNSKPVGVQFNLDQEIVFNNKEYKIVSISELYDDKRLHHYEIGVV